MPRAPSIEQLLFASERRLATVRGELASRWHVIAATLAHDGHTLIVAGDGALRTLERQRELYALGRKEVAGRWVVVDKSLVVTNAIGLDGPHPKGAALDAAFVVEGRYSQAESCPWGRYGALARGAGLIWGGDWKKPDRPHVELPGWRDLSP